MKNANLSPAGRGSRKNNTKLAQEPAGYLQEVNQDIDAFRAGKLKESLKALGYTFASPEEEATFREKRITVVHYLDSPEKVRLYIDFGTGTRIMLAEYNTGEIQDSGEIQVRDIYYEAPRAGAQEPELHIQHL